MAMTEKIPEKIRIGNKTVNLTKETLPVDGNGDVMRATFETIQNSTKKNDNKGLIVILKVKESQIHPFTKMDEEIENTAIRVV